MAAVNYLRSLLLFKLKLLQGVLVLLSMSAPPVDKSSASNHVRAKTRIKRGQRSHGKNARSTLIGQNGVSGICDCVNVCLFVSHESQEAEPCECWQRFKEV